MIVKDINKLNLDHINNWLNFESRAVSFCISETLNTPLSSIACIQVDYEDNNDFFPKDFFIKMTRLDAEGKPSGRGEKEVKFYKELSGLINKKNIPNCYFADFDSNGYYNIVLDNLSSTHNCERWDDEIVYEQYKLALKCLAEIHAKWWSNPDLEKILGNGLSSGDWNSYYERNLDCSNKFINKYKEKFKPEHIETYREFTGYFHANIDRYLSGKNLTLVHRDPHFWNFLFPKNKKDDVYLIDWDSYRMDIPTHDIAYFIAVHWNREERSQYEKPLLEYYYEQLLEKGVENYSFEDLLSDYKISVASMIFLSGMKERIGIPERVWLNQFGNIMDAIEDLECIRVVK